MPNRILGPNIKRLLAYKVAHDAVPPGGGMASTIAMFTMPDRLAQLSREGLAWCDQAIQTVRSAPDNPYGDDEEAIAGAILTKLEKKG